MESAKQSAIKRMNQLGSEGEPFLFIVDFSMLHPEIIPLKEINPSEIFIILREYLITEVRILSVEILSLRNIPPHLKNIMQHFQWCWKILSMEIHTWLI
jgi:hypothetical protein